MSTITKYWTIIILSILAFFNAGYLTNQAYTLEKKMAETQGTYTSFCDINDKLSCSNVLLSPYAKVFGLPFPAVAMVVYPLILLVAILGLMGIFKSAFSALMFMGLGGMMFNGYFIFQEAVNIGAFCLLCIICSGIIITIFGLSFSEVYCKRKVLAQA